MAGGGVGGSAHQLIGNRNRLPKHYDRSVSGFHEAILTLVCTFHYDRSEIECTDTRTWHYVNKSLRS